MMDAKQQIDRAHELGRQAFEGGAPCAPILDSDMMAMLEGRRPGKHPSGEASTTMLLNAWRAAWSVAQHAACLSDDPAAYIQPLPSSLLLRIAQGHIDVQRLAAAELASRGAGLSGEWVGFDTARMLWEKFRQQEAYYARVQSREGVAP